MQRRSRVDAATQSMCWEELEKNLRANIAGTVMEKQEKTNAKFMAAFQGMQAELGARMLEQAERIRQLEGQLADAALRIPPEEWTR